MRVVLDTNIVLSALQFPRGQLSWIRDVWTAGRIEPLVSGATARELIAALAYPKFQLGDTEIETLLAACLPFTDAVDVTADTIIGVPRCTDPEDQKFLSLAATGRADVLVSGDRAILRLAASSPFRIESPAEFRRRFVARARMPITGETITQEMGRSGETNHRRQGGQERRSRETRRSGDFLAD